MSPATKTPSDQVSNYMLYRGKCKEMSEAAVVANPMLRLVRGHYYCPLWNSNEPHWWTVMADGTIHDPTALQFPSKGHGVYTEFDGMCECAECGKRVHEDDATIGGNYAFCCGTCYGRFVGVY